MTTAIDLRQATIDKLIEAGPAGVTLADLAALDPRTAEHYIELLGDDDTTHIDARDYGPQGVTPDLVIDAHFRVHDLVRDGAVLTVPPMEVGGSDPESPMHVRGSERVVLHGWSTLPVRRRAFQAPEDIPQHTDPEAIIVAWLTGAGGGGAARGSIAWYCKAVRDTPDRDPYMVRVFHPTVERLREQGWDIRTYVLRALGDVWYQLAARPGEALLDAPIDGEALIGLPEAARITGLAEESIRRYVRRGTIPAPVPVEGSRALVWRRADLEDWARRERKPGPKGPRNR